jgi:YD repeat-containing protein
MTRTFLIIFSALVIHTSSLHSQGLDSIKGGYTSCHIYEYTYKSGVPDLSSKKEMANYKYNAAGKMTEKQCFADPCKTIFEDIYISNVAKEKYIYDDHGNITEETYYDPGGILLIKITRKFDSLGNNTEELLFRSDELSVKTLNKFDKAGNKLEEIKYKGADYVKNNWAYDPNGNLIEQIIYYSSNSKTYKYTSKLDEYGNPVEYRSDAEDSPVSYTNYVYDKDGNVLEVSSSGARDYEKHSYKYDSIGRVIEHESYYQSLYHTSVSKTTYAADGSRIVVTDNESWYPAIDSTKYNANGNITESSSYTRDGVEVSKTVNTYDDFGNPLEIIQYIKSETPATKTEYVYSK